MRCPRCEQEGSVERQGNAWACRACPLTFSESTQVFRPILKGARWVERATGQLVAVLDVQGDSFDPKSPVRYQAEDEPSRIMLAEDFRYYFRAHDPPPFKVVPLPCRAGEEWEAKSGQLYMILDIDPKQGKVHILRDGLNHVSFWVDGRFFLDEFRRFERRTDFSRLLDDER